MFFSNYNATHNKRLLTELGFSFECCEIVRQDYEECCFMWVIARKA